LFAPIGCLPSIITPSLLESNDVFGFSNNRAAANAHCVTMPFINTWLPSMKHCRTSIMIGMRTCKVQNLSDGGLMWQLCSLALPTTDRCAAPRADRRGARPWSGQAALLREYCAAGRAPAGGVIKRSGWWLACRSSPSGSTRCIQSLLRPADCPGEKSPSNVFSGSRIGSVYVVWNGRNDPDAAIFQTWVQYPTHLLP
jgi:hypothetical protein